MNQRASARPRALKVSSSLVTFPLLEVPTGNSSLTQACIKFQMDNIWAGWELSRNNLHPGCCHPPQQEDDSSRTEHQFPLQCTPQTCLCLQIRARAALRSCNISNISVGPHSLPLGLFLAQFALQPCYCRLNPRTTRP